MTGAEDELIAAARNAMKHAHAPYSRFAVGAAVRLSGGAIVTGSNFENASYGLSLCAETVALACANAQGRLSDVEAIAMAGGYMAADGTITGHDIVTPCGRCRCSNAGGRVTRRASFRGALPSPGLPTPRR